NVELAGGRDVSLAVDPRYSAPPMSICRVHLPQCRDDALDPRMLFYYLVDHAEKGGGIELRFGGNLRAGDAQTLLQILFVADQHIDIFDNTSDHFHGAFVATGNIPELLPVI